MEVLVAETGPCSRSLTITVPATLVDQQIEQMYGSAQKQVQLKGFRPGKVPRHLLQKRFGDSILAEAKEQLLNRFFGEACQQQDLAPVGRVEIDGVENIAIKPGSQLQFTAKLDVRPQFELGNVEGIEVDAVDTVANDGDIDNALKEIAYQKRSIQPTTEAAEDGDFLRVDLQFATADGKVVHERKGVQMNTRIAVHGAEPEAYKAATLGAKAGDQRSMPITFPDTFEKAEFRGQSGTATFAVHEVLRVMPAAIDEALAKSLEFDTVDALRTDLGARITQEKSRLGRQRQEEQCLLKLLETHPIALPPSLVEEQKRASLASFAQRMQQNGMPEEEIQQKLTESDGEAQADAERRVRLFFLVEAVARQQQLFVTESDLEQELRNIAAANSTEGRTISPAQVRQHFEQQNQLGELRLGLLERKVRDFLRGKAKIVDKKDG